MENNQTTTEGLPLEGNAEAYVPRHGILLHGFTEADIPDLIEALKFTHNLAIYHSGDLPFGQHEKYMLQQVQTLIDALGKEVSNG